jgi:hypothetical protein
MSEMTIGKKLMIGFAALFLVALSRAGGGAANGYVSNREEKIPGVRTGRAIVPAAELPARRHVVFARKTSAAGAEKQARI